MNEDTNTFETIFSICLKTQSKNPVEIIRIMMAKPFCHMHGPEHHFMVGAALLTAFKNAGGQVNLEEALKEMQNRAKSVPGGACGYWGACGAGISTGMFVSIILKASPLTQESCGQTILMTSRALEAIGKIGGPRCCKRDCYLAILSAIDFVKEHFGIEMEGREIICIHSSKNSQCIGARCPFAK